MNDTERIDGLERLLCSSRVGNGVAIMLCSDATRRRLIDLIDLGDEDGSNLGETLTDSVLTLREAIDLALQKTPGQAGGAYSVEGEQ